MSRLSAALVLTAALGLLAAVPAQAVQRAYVSAVSGNDANTATSCQANAPCRWFATAVTVVDPGGEVVAMDTGAYGGINLTQSIAITAAPGAYAGISVFSGAGIIIATAGINVTLRGLTINGMGGTTGVSITNAASVSFENCVIANFINGSSNNYAGISVIGPVPVRIIDTVLRNNYYGVALQSGASADIGSSRFLGNSTNGAALYVGNSGIGPVTSATLSTSLVTGGYYGVYVYAAAGSTAKAAIIRSTVSNSTSGVNSQTDGSAGAAAVVTLSGSLVTGNGTGLNQTSTATLKSVGNNTVSENGANVSGSITSISPM